MMPGLYIHIPFCVRKCDYCAFYSVVSKDWKKQELFFQSLEQELRGLPPDFSPRTIFVGGGTPTAPDFQTLETFFPILGNFSPEEFSVEVNPGTVDAAKLSLLKRNGVNRLSIGVQSFDSDCLETLGRIHSAEQAEDAFRRARAAGFENISIDLMFGTPGQTVEMLDADLDRAIALGPEHIAIYNLMYEEGTPLTERGPPRLDEDLERDMYDRIRARLKAAGFVHYEISNFAKPGFECRHNLLYWTGGDYIGCGPAAHSHWQGTRWANVADLDEYCRNVGSAGGVALPVSSDRDGGARPPGEPMHNRANDGSAGGVAPPLTSGRDGEARPPGELMHNRANDGSAGGVALPVSSDRDGGARPPGEPMHSQTNDGSAGGVALPVSSEFFGGARPPGEPMHNQANDGSAGGVAPPLTSEFFGGARPPGELMHSQANDGSAGGVAPPVSSDRDGGRASLSERAADWPPREFEETLDPDAKERETLVMGLRLLAGVDVSARQFEMQRSCFQRLERDGLLEIDGRRVRLTEDALFVSDAVFAELV